MENGNDGHDHEKSFLEALLSKLSERLKTKLELIANQTIYIETTVFSEIKYLILTINWQ